MIKIRHIVIAAASLVGSCASQPSETTDCTGAKCDEIPDDQVPVSPCDDHILDFSGANNKKVAGRLNDVFANLVLRTGTTCPTTFNGIMDKLRELDTAGCVGDERAGIQTRVISETAQATGKPTTFRSVTTRRCGGRPMHGFFISLLDVPHDAAVLPDKTELIAFDQSAGVFNYYDTDGTTLRFFGNSKDMLKGNEEGDIRKCAQCHTGGGLVMKELDTPWLNWEGHNNTPQAQEYVARHKNLGRKSTGAEFEQTVNGGNVTWNQTRLAHLTRSGTVSVADLLRPLFCTVEINVDNGSDFQSPVGGGLGGDQLREVKFDSLLDPMLKPPFGGIPVAFGDYDALIKANGQHVPGIPGSVDTIFDHEFPERARADVMFVENLQSAKHIDADFVKDVLMVDFTRPVFSDDRCGLLAFAPQLTPDQFNPQAIRDGFIKNLEAAELPPDGPAAALLANLKTAGDSTAHTKRVEDFLVACQGLGSPTLLKNALTVHSLSRDIARKHPLFAFIPATMPDDNQQVDPNVRLDPNSCQLVTKFVR